MWQCDVRMKDKNSLKKIVFCFPQNKDDTNLSPPMWRSYKIHCFGPLQVLILHKLLRKQPHNQDHTALPWRQSSWRPLREREKWSNTVHNCMYITFGMIKKSNQKFCMYLWPGRDQRCIWLPRPHCSWSHPSAHLGALWAWCKNALYPEHEETEHSGRWRTALGTTPTEKQQYAALNSNLSLAFIMQWTKKGFLPSHNQELCEAVGQTVVFWAFSQISPYRTFHKYLKHLQVIVKCTYFVTVVFFTFCICGEKLTFPVKNRYEWLEFLYFFH